MKIAIKLTRVYWNNNSGVAELEILDPELQGDSIPIKLRTNEMTVIDVKKEWVEQED